MSGQPLYILLLNIHGLVRGRHLELGRDADTGGQTKYVLELAQALSRHRGIKRVDLMTRLLVDPQLSADYSQPQEALNEKATIARISCGVLEYLPKEELWDYLDNFADNAMDYLREQGELLRRRRLCGHPSLPPVGNSVDPHGPFPGALEAETAPGQRG
jgi:sucrose-phosphate synthase